MSESVVRTIRATTDRLAIRAATPDDAAPTWAYRRLPEVHEWLPSAPADRVAWTTLFVLPERIGRTLVVEHEDAVVGDLYLDVQDAWVQAEVAEQGSARQAAIGWVLDPAHGGRGLATEAVAALVRVCFEDLGLRRVTATCFADNEPSWRLMERLGMRRETHSVRDALHRTRGWLDGYTYALLADEWRARQPA